MNDNYVASVPLLRLFLALFFHGAVIVSGFPCCVWCCHDAMRLASTSCVTKWSVLLTFLFLRDALSACLGPSWGEDEALGHSTPCGMNILPPRLAMPHRGWQKEEWMRHTYDRHT